MEQQQNKKWGGNLEFLMACIATSIGLGNVWRFPFTAYENGGGAFVVPYLIVLFLIGKPFYYLEGLLGQFTSRSCIKTWSMCPAMKGLGYGQVIGAFCVVTYYCSLTAITLYYFVASFQKELPWSYCRDEWKSHCLDLTSNNSELSNSNVTVQTSAELYFRRLVLNEKETIDDGIGWPSLELAACLFGSWVCIFLVLAQGIRTTGKVTYFLAIFPYIMMIALFGRAVTLEGAIEGIMFFLTPKWDKLFEPAVWYAAITQCFFSLSVCFGPIITYSSFNDFHHKVHRDVMIVTTLDTFTSLMAGCTIFGILGNLMHEMGTNDISKVVRGGTGLAFISYPDALSRFTVVPQLFSVLFFFMIFVLGTGSVLALSTAIFSILCDLLPKVSNWKLVLGVCTIGYLCGIVYISPGGQWFVTLVDYYGGTFIAIIVGVFEMMTIFWIYGLQNFLNDVEFMLGSKPGLYWRVCWTLLTPLIMTLILLYTIVMYQAPTYDGQRFPDYAYVIGWILLGIGICQMFVFASQEILKSKKSSIISKIRDAFGPSDEWGPCDSKMKMKWIEYTREQKFKFQNRLVDLFFK